MTRAAPPNPPASGSKTRRSRDVPTLRGGVLLQPRDIYLLVDLHAYGCMLRGQIQQLYFGSVQRANARLRQLFDACYVARAEMPLPSFSDAPSGCQMAYLLGSAGISVVAARLGIDPAEVRRQQRHGTPAYLLHTVEIVNLRLAAMEASKLCPEMRIERFLPERLCQHTYQYREREAEADEAVWRREVYKPDGVMLLEYPGGKAGFAIEVDLGHTSSNEFQIKTRIHARYARSGLFQRRYGMEKVSTLCVTTGATRRDNLCRLLEREGESHFLFSTFTDIRQQGFFGSVWHRPEHPASLHLLEAILSSGKTGQIPQDIKDKEEG